jgi:hypothetical protein
VREKNVLHLTKIERRRHLISSTVGESSTEALARIEQTAEGDVCIQLQVVTPSRTSQPWKPEPATPTGHVLNFDEYPLPTPDELARHVTRFGREGTDKLRQLVSNVDSADKFAAKSERANATEQARKRSKRRVGIEDELKALVERKPELIPDALADELNISPRRTKELLQRLGERQEAALVKSA